MGRKYQVALMLATVLVAGLLSGCVSYHYIVPAPIIEEYPDPLPIQCGFLMPRELRDQWFEKRTTRTRIDVPVGKVVLDFANAYLQNAFRVPEPEVKPGTTIRTTRDFYDVRYYDRRSEKGILIMADKIEFRMVGDQSVHFELTVRIEDALRNDFISKTYIGDGSPKEGAGMLQKTIYEENMIELSTAAAMGKIYRDMLIDIRSALGR